MAAPFVVRVCERGFDTMASRKKGPRRSTVRSIPPNVAEQRAFSLPRPSHTKLSVARSAPGQGTFQPVPPHVGPKPYRMDLGTVLGSERMQQIQAAGRIVAHIGGDCGGVKKPEDQEIVAQHLERDFSSPDVADHPAFFYMLGDVVYYYGAATEYEPQFYEPYQYYPAPIMSVPGNHDGDVDPTDPNSAPTLDAWMRNFCAPRPIITPEGHNYTRTAMTQPGPYWTLETPYMRFIGLYSNVPEGGEIDATQTGWLAGELRAAQQDRVPAVLCLHHPPYSGDAHHSGSQAMIDVIAQAVRDSGNQPHAVFAAHVHNYQRFTLRTRFENQPIDIPYLVVGAIGYWHLHSMSKLISGKSLPLRFPGEHPGLSLDWFVHDRHGYMKLDFSRDHLEAQYFTCPRSQEPWSAPAVLADSFTLDLNQRRIVAEGKASGFTDTSGLNLLPVGAETDATV
jgi:acid phosphatase type 7